MHGANSSPTANGMLMTITNVLRMRIDPLAPILQKAEPVDRLGDRFGVDVVVLIRFHVWLHILRWHQSHLVPLFAQCSAEKVRSAAGFHPYQFDTSFFIHIFYIGLRCRGIHYRI